MLADEICAYLATASLGLTVGTNLFDVPFPLGAPDDATCLIEYHGEDAEDTFGGSLAAESVPRPRFQMVTRSKNAGTARQTAWNVAKKLRNLGPATLSSVRYLQIDMLGGGPIPLRIDESGRQLFATSFQAWKEESP